MKLLYVSVVAVAAFASPAFAWSPCSALSGGDGAAYWQCIKRNEGVEYKDRDAARRDFEERVGREMERLRASSR